MSKIESWKKRGRFNQWENEKAGVLLEIVDVRDVSYWHKGMPNYAVVLIRPEYKELEYFLTLDEANKYAVWYMKNNP